MAGDRQKGDGRDLLVSNGSGGPDIPLLKKKDEKEEKKGTGLVAAPGGGGGGGGKPLFRWLGVGGRPGQALSGAGKAALGAAGAGAVSRSGLIPGLVNFFSSNGGLALLTALLSGLAFYGFYAFSLSPRGGASGRYSVFPQRESSALTSAESKRGEEN